MTSSNDETNSNKPKIVLSLDVGTTFIKALAIHQDGTILGRSNAQVNTACTKAQLAPYFEHFHIIEFSKLTQVYLSFAEQNP